MKQIIISIFTFIQLLTSSSAQSYNIDSLNQKAMDYYNHKTLKIQIFYTMQVVFMP